MCQGLGPKNTMKFRKSTEGRKRHYCRSKGCTRARDGNADKDASFVFYHCYTNSNNNNNNEARKALIIYK